MLNCHQHFYQTHSKFPSYTIIWSYTFIKFTNFFQPTLLFGPTLVLGTLEYFVHFFRFENERPALLRPTSLYYPTSTPVAASSSAPTPSAASTTGATTAPVVSSVASKDPPSASSNFKTSNSSNNLSDYYRIYKPSNGGLIISQKGGNFTRTGSFSNRQIQPQPTLASQTGSGLGSKPESTFMRSFSFRKREANDEHHSSMPCLNANFRFVFCLFVYLS